MFRGIVVGVIVLLIGAAILVAWVCLRSIKREKRDTVAITQWLRTNTADLPGRTHATSEEIAQGTGLSPDRVRKICVTDKRILPGNKHPF